MRNDEASQDIFMGAWRRSGQFESDYSPAEQANEERTSAIRKEVRDKENLEAELRQVVSELRKLRNA